MMRTLRRCFAMMSLLVPTFAHAAGKQAVQFVRVSDGKVLYEQNAQELLSPASVTKLITSAAALQILGPDYHFRTRLLTTGRRQNTTLYGNLILKGDGDPFLVNEKLWPAIADVAHLGIRQITGDIIIDESLFEDESRDKERARSEMNSAHAYDAPVSAAGVNFNTFGVALTPGSNSGAAGQVSIDPYFLPQVSIVNKLKTVPRSQGKSFQVSRSTDANSGDAIIVTGSIGQNENMVKVYRSVEDPIRMAGETLRAFFQRENIQIRGQVKRGKVPSDAKELYVIESYDLGYILKGLNHFSNNYIADVMTKRLGVAIGQKGTFADGAQALTQFMRKQVGIKDTFHIENGSGLTTKNQITAAQLNQVLVYMARNFEFFPDFVASLPAAGISGTLSERFSNELTEEFIGKIRAKTGTLSEPISVASLAGYFFHSQHGLIAFTMMDNGVPGQTQPAIGTLRRQQDAQLKAIVDKI